MTESSPPAPPSPEIESPSTIHTKVGEPSTLPSRVLYDLDSQNLFRYRKGLNSVEKIRVEAARMTYGEIVEICVSLEQEREGVHPPTKWFGTVYKHNILKRCIQCGKTLESGRWTGKIKRVDWETGQKKKNFFLRHEKISAGVCDPCGNRCHRYGAWCEQEDIRWRLNILESRKTGPLMTILVIMPIIRSWIDYSDPTIEDMVMFYQWKDRWTTKDLDPEAEIDSILRVVDKLYKRMGNLKRRLRLRRRIRR